LPFSACAEAITARPAAVCADADAGTVTTHATVVAAAATSAAYRRRNGTRRERLELVAMTEPPGLARLILSLLSQCPGH
jgi:hypothetical protein